MKQVMQKYTLHVAAGLLLLTGAIILRPATAMPQDVRVRLWKPLAPIPIEIPTEHADAMIRLRHAMDVSIAIEQYEDPTAWSTIVRYNGYTWLNEYHFDQLRKLRNVKRVVIASTNRISNSQVELVEFFPDCEYFELRSPYVTDESAPSVLRLKNLKSITLDCPRLTPEFFSSLTDLKQLKHLIIDTPLDVDEQRAISRSTLGIKLIEFRALRIDSND